MELKPKVERFQDCKGMNKRYEHPFQSALNLFEEQFTTNSPTPRAV